MGLRYLLDTNICVFLMRGKYEIDKCIKNVGIDSCGISEITVAELLFGAECSKDPEENRSLVEEFCSELEIVPITDCIPTYAKQKALLKSKGSLIDDFDLIIACTAITHDLIAVTDNTKHFDRLPVKIENWVKR